MKLEYSSNNSGGSWWLSDEDWLALEAAGWIVDWYATRKDRITDDYVKYGGEPNTDQYPGGKFLGALASNAYKIVGSKDEANEAVSEWERLTGSNAASEGCSCCGQPHYFSLSEEMDCEKCDESEELYPGDDCRWCEGTGKRDHYVASFDVEVTRVKKGF